jgi:hypothetical protein
VRPSGITAYYSVRAAIKSWDSDFGYELIGDDWKLAFPPPDPKLAEVERQAVQQGREYQARVAMAAPSKYARRKPSYRAAPHRGGVIIEQGGGGEGSLTGSGGGRRPRSASFDGLGNDSDGGRQRQSSQTNAARTADAGKPAPRGTSGGAPGGANSQGGAFPGGTAPSGGVGTPGTSAFDNPGQRRAPNWALPDASTRAVAVTRSVRVVCRDDRFVILTDRGLEGSRTVMLKPATHQSIDEFVSALWEHMKSWGIAGNGLFWRPVLVLQVMAGGEERARDLRILLENSGVEVREAEQP